MAGSNNVLRGIAAAVLVLFFAGSIFFSCSRDTAEPSVLLNENVEFNLTGMIPAAVDNTQVYLFKGDEPNHSAFARRVSSISRTEDNRLNMFVPVGTWDVALVATNDGNGMDRLIQPVEGMQRDGQKMFELKPIGGVLYSAPEFLTADIERQIIEPDRRHEAETSFSRNVALIRFVIQQPRGFDTSSDQHHISIGNIPSTLDWAGRLYPDADHPATCGENRMEGRFHIEDAGGGSQRSDTVSFIVPAHKGATQADTTTHKLNVAVSLALEGNDRYTTEEPVTIPVVPKANKILLVRLLVDGELTVESDILPWVDETPFTAEIANPDSQLKVDKTLLNLRPENDNMIATALSSGVSVRPGVEPGDDWVGYQWGAGNSTTLTVTGDPHSYDGVLRSSHINLVVNNFKKEIDVTQVHTATNSIGINLPKIVFTKDAPEVDVTVTTTSSAGWRVSKGFLKAYSDSGNTGEIKNATLRGLEGTSGGRITLHSKYFPNEDDDGEYSIFENDTLRIHNAVTLEVAKVIVHNVYMTTSAPIGVDIPKTTARATFTYDNLELYGGTKSFTVERTPGYPSPWIESMACVPNLDPATKADKPYVIQLTVLREGPNDEWAPTKIRIRNVDAPAYFIDVDVIPALVPALPPFDYFVVKYSWSGSDLDIAFLFHDESIVNQPAFYDKYVGYNGSTAARSILANGDDFSGSGTPSSPIVIEWAGDGASSGNKEETFFNAKTVEAMTSLPRKVILEVRAIWWSGGSSTKQFTVSIEPWQGGKMRIYQYGYINDPVDINGDGDYNDPDETGKNLYMDPTLVPDRSIYTKTCSGIHVGSGVYGRDRTLVCTIIYDRVTRQATPVWNTAVAHSAAPLPSPEPPAASSYEDPGLKTPEQIAKEASAANHKQ
jgi:hypothetical protein